MRKFYLISIFLLEIFITKPYAQSYSLAKADSLYQNGEFFEANIECERVIYFSSNPNKQRVALYKKALALKQIGQYTKAVDALQQIRVSNPNDSLFFLKHYETALCQFLAEDFVGGTSTLKYYEMLTATSTMNADMAVIKSLTLNSTHQFDKALAAISQYADALPDSSRSEFIAQVEKLYSKKHRPRILKPELAKNLSMFVPGSGQMYVGNIGEGALSFLLNLASLTFGVYHVYLRFYFTGYVVGFSLLNKFHKGGMRRVKNLAEVKNKKRTAEFNANLLKLIENYERSSIQ